MDSESIAFSNKLFSLKLKFSQTNYLKLLNILFYFLFEQQNSYIVYFLIFISTKVCQNILMRKFNPNKFHERSHCFSISGVVCVILNKKNACFAFFIHKNIKYKPN
jgi:hypothetical protein